MAPNVYFNIVANHTLRQLKWFANKNVWNCAH
jgi:hypothetical protein